ncbi:MAG: hypothetical protein NTY61_01145, partial [Candidatus Parcubacteria bacterium]|nr:hypothetical protein [Candidatus Parcubacteria bacterium]
TNSGTVTFAFGAPASIYSNVLLSQITERLATNIGAPVFTQLDIQLRPDVDVQRVEEVTGHPPPTLRIARQAIRWARERDIKRLYVVAARPHLWRALRDARQAVCETGENIEIRAYGEPGEYSENSWFCPESTQSRTQSRKSWNERERLLKILPFWIYKRIAS